MVNLLGGLCILVNNKTKINISIICKINEKKREKER